MKKIYLLLSLSLLISIGASAQTMEDYLQAGIDAYNQEHYAEMEIYLSKAAKLGSDQAAGMLAVSYAYGLMPGGKDYDKAFDYAQQGAKNFSDGNKLAIATLGKLVFHVSESKENFELSEKILLCAWEKGMEMSNIGLLISACYIKLGDIDSAKFWANKVIDMVKDKSDEAVSYRMANALLGKIALDKHDYAEALSLSMDGAKEDDSALGQYIMGRCMIKLNTFPQVGKQRVKCAFLAEEDDIDDINCFHEEIADYWNKIKEKDFE